MSFGSQTPMWPLATPPKKWTAGGSYGAKRPSSKTYTRHHQGTDLYAPQGAPVFAMEDGIIVADQGWSGPGTKAVFVESKDTGVVLVYGAVAPGSYPPKGTKVLRGQQIATVGVYPAGSTMLHMETWKAGTRPPRPAWNAGKAPPPQLLDVGEYLTRAMAYPHEGGQQQKKLLVPGGDVTASSDPFSAPYKGDLTYPEPCSYFDGQMFCTVLDSTGWRQSLKRELDVAIPLFKLAKANIKWSTQLASAEATTQGGLQAYNDWSALDWPPDAVDDLREVTAAVRAAGQTFAAALQSQPQAQPQAEYEDELDPDPVQAPAKSPGPQAQDSKAGIVLAVAVGLGALAFLK